VSEIYALVDAALRQVRASVYGAEVCRDYCYADDVGEGVALLTLANTLTWNIYNVGSGTAHTVREVAVELTNLIPGFEWGPVDNPTAADLVVFPEKERGPMDPTRLLSDLNFGPQYSLARGLLSYVSWLQAASDAR
jgi:nucleoside-diphosphate-sugar epimerase